MIDEESVFEFVEICGAAHGMGRGLGENGELITAHTAITTCLSAISVSLQFIICELPVEQTGVMVEGLSNTPVTLPISHQ